jgi:hypothetical protein
MIYHIEQFVERVLSNLHPPATCVAQTQTGYIKSNITKHIVYKLFYPHELQKSADINILQVKLCNNLVDLFTKSLPTTTFEKYVHEIDMRHFEICKDRRSIPLNHNTFKYYITLLFPLRVKSHDFHDDFFNEILKEF